MVYNWKNNPIVQDAISKMSCYVSYFANIKTFNEHNKFQDYDFYEKYDPQKQYCHETFSYDYGNGTHAYKYEVHHVIFYDKNYDNCIDSSVYVVAREILTPEEKTMYTPFCRCIKCRIANVIPFNLSCVSCNSCISQWGNTNQKVIKDTRKYMKKINNTS